MGARDQQEERIDTIALVIQDHGTAEMNQVFENAYLFLLLRRQVQFPAPTQNQHVGTIFPENLVHFNKL